MSIKDLEELFEAAIRAVPAYPVTLFRVYASPGRVLRTPRDSFTCSPGVALLFSFIFGYFVFMYVSGALKPGQEMFEGPPVSWLVFSVVFVALVIALQRAFVRLIVPKDSRQTGDQQPLLRDLAAFTYAYSAVLPIGALLLPLSRKTPSLSVAFVVGLYTLYGWSAFNMIRARFGITVRRSIVGVLLSFMAIGIVGGIGFALLILPFRKGV